MALQAALKAMDADLRKTTCPICGKPTGGIVFSGETAEQSGICTSAEHIKRGEARSEAPKA
jgi:hypothetical protein